MCPALGTKAMATDKPHYEHTVDRDRGGTLNADKCLYQLAFFLICWLFGPAYAQGNYDMPGTLVTAGS